jgi:hypothetical protein
MQRFCFGRRFCHAEGSAIRRIEMKKLMIGLAAAGLGALLSIGGANAQAGAGQTGMGDAGQKAAPTSMTMGKKGGGMYMKRHHRKYRRHHRRYR